MTRKAMTRVFIPLCLLVSGQVYAASWESTGSLNIPRDQFAGGMVGDYLYAFGGNGNPDGVNLASLEIYDVATGVWSIGPANSQSAEELSGASINGKFYVFGAWGGGTPYGVFNFVEEFDPATGQWRALAPKPTIVSSAPAAVYNNEAFLFGGIYTNETLSDPTWYGVVEAYNPVTDSWRTVTEMPQALQNMAVAVHQDTVFFFGGFYGASGREAVQTDVIAYHLPTDSWITSGLGTLPDVRFYGYQSAAPIVDGRVYLVGGYGLSDPHGPLDETNVRTLTDVLVYDVASGQFSRETSLPEPRSGHVVLHHNGYLYAIGGELSSGRTGETLRLPIMEDDPVSLPGLVPTIDLLLLDDE